MSRMKTKLKIVRSLENHKRLQGRTVGEIAEELGMFPSEVEEELRELHDIGAVTCYMFQGQLYAVYNEGGEEKLKKWQHAKDIMYH